MSKIKYLDSLMEQALKDGVFPGCNYCLIESGNKHFNSFGFKALIPKKEENDVDTIYDMASLTKVIATVTSILILMEQGKLRLYDNVKQILPDFKNPKTTVFDLITHTAGLKPGISYTEYIGKPKEQFVKAIYELDPSNEIGEKIIYSDLGFIYLGWIIEKISGLSLPEFTFKYLFEPLEMYRTGYNLSPDLHKTIAPTEVRKDRIANGPVRGVVHDEKAYLLGGACGHAGLFSCVKDVSHFMEMVLNDGIYKGKRILSKATIDLMFTELASQKENETSVITEKRSVGWTIMGSYPQSGCLASSKTIMHTGFTGTHLFVDRYNQVAFCVLSNRVHPTRENNKIIGWRGRIGNYVISHFGKGCKDEV